ncbi:YggS family pyridoxal phosphate-dependent enzyme [Jatrophihabitans endophyticus]|uniref:YggS family pyridoxal phosphate-dependent enzyme n=1 Tax=Jatrophihabitans endophyticus TaxID=1206085 RepID=UPI001A08B464|nr:YggS family pyridoxal phosphate-dependent enzyme [Jatrophihabitans endophyticus]MBE7188803.1 YggS family pyridoxal phosphate-dependent enzyme [Jatrophihabitans endophyticus]
MTDADATGGRRQAELVTRLGAVRARIGAACDAAGTDMSTVTLIAVTKNHAVDDIATLARLSVFDIGESKDQEARAKLAELDETARSPLRWHLVGRLQTNKVNSVVTYAHAVHSVDRPKLARALADAAAERRSTPLEVFCQVSLDGDPDRGGVLEADLPALADLVAGRDELVLRGVMAVAPMDAEPDAAFEQLARISARLRREHPDADAISAGMSGDLEAAVRQGSTHVRVGSALLGRRDQIFS